MVLKNLPWVVGGGVVLVLLMALVFRYEVESTRVALDAQRAEKVARMRAALSSSTEAEKSAVMAPTEEEARKFAEQARASSAELRRLAAGLRPLLQDPREKQLLAEFEKSSAELTRVDAQLLDLAVQSTNQKATALTFGPAAQASQELDELLSMDLDRSPKLAATAQAGALRIQALLPPHIAEESDARMDELEARMRKQEHEVNQALKALGDEKAQAAWSRFEAVKTQILKLSRENTNVRSLAISLHEKRTLTALCQEELAALQKVIEEPGQSPIRPR